jgi:thymidylate synthase
VKSYLELVQKVLTEGKLKQNRTGVSALTIAGAMLQHDLQEGFPLLTTKKMAFKAVRVELEFFIKGLTDKSWLKERGCHIWDEWCTPDRIPAEASDEERKKIQMEENDLGPIYGFQWRNFGQSDKIPNGIDQLKQVVETLKNNPSDRRMLVSAWNPLALPHQALPPCHVLFHLVVIDNRLNLSWFQRSCDLMLGIPFNLPSYSILLHLLAKEAGLEAGIVTGMLSDVHIYENHIAGAKEQLQREPMSLPQIETNDFTSIFNWQYDQTTLLNYASHPKISFPIAV